MDTATLIRSLCKEKDIAYHRLEVDLGFANGYIGKLQGNKIAADRLYKIAEYLDVTPEFLLTGEKSSYYESDTAEMAQKFAENRELKLLFDVAKDSTPEDINTIYQVLLALKRKERQ